MKHIRPSYCVDTIFHIDYKSLWQEGIRLLVFDLDHTLLSTKSRRLSVQTRRKLRELKTMGFEIAFLSNTVVPWRQKRVREIVASAKIKVVCVTCNYFHCKPNRWGFDEVCKLSGITAENAVMIGDMLLRDIFGAQQAGYRLTILVKPHGPDNIFLLRCRRQERKIKTWLAEIGLYSP